MKLEVDRSATRRITDRDRLIARQAQPEDAKALAAWKDGWHLEVRMRGRLVGESHGFATFGGGLAAAITDWHAKEEAA